MSQHTTQYLEYLKSKEWADLRVDIFLSRGRRCERCKSTKKLQVHHLTYKNLGCEEPQDLEILCEDCHKKEHPDKIKPFTRLKAKPVTGKMGKRKKKRLEKMRAKEIRAINIGRRKSHIRKGFTKIDGVWYENKPQYI